MDFEEFLRTTLEEGGDSLTKFLEILACEPEEKDLRWLDECYTQWSKMSK